MHYGARFYSPRLGRFVSADTIVPQPGNPQALNRYAYAANNPVIYTDPSGHCIPCVNCPGDLYEEAPTLVSDVERLVGMFGGSKTIPATTALERVLDYTRSPGLEGRLGVQFGVKFGDTGFREEFRDSHLYAEQWGMSYLDSNQVGHFLTAASLGYKPVLGRESISLIPIIGHEKVSDAGLSRSTTSGPVGDPFALSEQIAAGMVGYLSSEGIVFEVACTSDKDESYEMRDIGLGIILGSGDLAKRRGNSMEDLHLSVKGWIMGQMIANGELKTNRDVADWLTTNLAAP
jgi:hypothetical protein